jgi:hypothetical protein
MKTIFAILCIALFTVACTQVKTQDNTTVQQQTVDGKTYISSDRENCKLLRFACAEGAEPFFDEKGCGCQNVTKTPGDDLVTLKYQPMQCTDEPWQLWYAQGEVRFVKAPTDAELITTFFSEQEIEVRDVQRIQSDMVTCQACDICPKGYSYQLKTDAAGAAKLAQLGWSQT